MNHALVLILCMAVLLASTSCGEGERLGDYEIIDLGPLEPNAVNERGEVVGSIVDETGCRRAVLWSDGETVDLGTLDGDAQSVANGINDAGQIVGISSGARGRPRPFIFEGGRMRTLDGIHRPAIATDIAEDGTVVGFYPIGDIDSRGSFRWRDGDLDRTYGAWEDRGEGFRALEINRFGTAGGGAFVSFRGFVSMIPVMWARGTAIPTSWSSRGGACAVNGLNDRAMFVGQHGSQEPHACLWEDHVAHFVTTDLGTLGGSMSVACAINNRGEVVGHADRTDDAERAFYWRAGLPMTDLDNHVADPEWVLARANGISDRGEIIGIGRRNGEQHGFLLRPARFPSSPPPPAVDPRQDEEETLRRLLALLENPEDDSGNETKRTIRSALAKLGGLGEGGDGAVPVIVDLLRHPDGDVRGRAAKALGDIGTRPDLVVPALVEARNDPDEAVARQARRALDRIDPRWRERP